MNLRSRTSGSFCRSLIAAAVAAVSLPAGAQSIQLYGIADIGVAATHFDGNTLTAVRENRTARWGIRGGEKLWGDLEVLFRLEGEVDMGTGQYGDGLFYRQAWAGVRGGYGTVRLGQTKDLFDDLSEEIDPFRNDGIVGDFSKRAWRVAVVKSRVSNSVTYEAPKFYGLKLAAQYSMDETAPGVGNPGWSVSGMYEYRDFMALAAYDRPTLTSAGPQPEAWVVGAAYRFGPVRVSASYNSGDLNNATSKTPSTELDSYTIGVAWDVGPGVAKAVYSSMDSSVGNVNASIRDVSVWGLGYDYVLSRRTTLYFIGLLETEGQYDSSTKKFVTGNTTGVQIGITHVF
jgi:predicted porin